MAHKLIKTDNYLLVVDDNKDIEENMWTVKDGKVREVSYLGQDNGYAIIAHLPLNGLPILEGVDLLPPYSRHQEDGLDDAVIRFKESWIKLGVTDFELSAFSEGYNKAREKYKYTEEDMIQCWNTASIDKHQVFGDQIGGYFKHYIQSLHQYPTEFECEMETVPHPPPSRGFSVVPKTITTAQGIQWVGKYK